MQSAAAKFAVPSTFRVSDYIFSLSQLIQRSQYSARIEYLKEAVQLRCIALLLPEERRPDEIEEERVHYQYKKVRIIPAA
jgi:hypothetical protein